MMGRKFWGGFGLLAQRDQILLAEKTVLRLRRDQGGEVGHPYFPCLVEIVATMWGRIVSESLPEFGGMLKLSGNAA